MSAAPLSRPRGLIGREHWSNRVWPHQIFALLWVGQCFIFWWGSPGGWAGIKQHLGRLGCCWLLICCSRSYTSIYGSLYLRCWILLLWFTLLFGQFKYFGPYRVRRLTWCYRCCYGVCLPFIWIWLLFCIIHKSVFGLVLFPDRKIPRFLGGASWLPFFTVILNFTICKAFLA